MKAIHEFHHHGCGVEEQDHANLLGFNILKNEKEYNLE
jgi:hypothetical protein